MLFVMIIPKIDFSLFVVFFFSKTISMLDAIAPSAVRFRRRLLCDYITAKVLIRLSILSRGMTNLQGGIILEASLH